MGLYLIQRQLFKCFDVEILATQLCPYFHRLNWCSLRIPYILSDSMKQLKRFISILFCKIGWHTLNVNNPVFIFPFYLFIQLASKSQVLIFHIADDDAKPTIFIDKVKLQSTKCCCYAINTKFRWFYNMYPRCMCIWRH